MSTEECLIDSNKEDKHELLGYNLGFSSFKNFNDFEILVDDDFFDSMIAGINQARKSVYIIMYIFSGQAAEKVLDALEEAQARGVKVYLMVDYLGSSMFFFSNEFVKRFKRLNFTYTFNRKRIDKINQRLHTKLIYIDNNIAWLGSHNIRDEILVAQGDSNAAHNVSIKFTGNATHQIANYIKIIFRYSANITLKNLDKYKTMSLKEEQESARLLFSILTPFPKSLESMYLDLIASAQKRCIIINPYFAPSESFVQSLKIAINKGVQVEIITPIKLDNIFTPLIDLYMCHMSSLGATIYRSEGAFDHSKIMIIDDNISVIGSYNNDLRSTLVNLEVVYEFRSAKVTEQFLALYEMKKQKARKWKTTRLPLRKRIIANLMSFSIATF